MLRFFLKRLVAFIPVLLGINFVVFSIMSMSGDPAVTVLGQTSTPEAREIWREEHGLNKPFIIQYVDNIKGLVTGNLGKSYATGHDILDEFFQRLPATLIIAAGSMIVAALIIGIPLGILSAIKQYSALDYIATFLALLLSAIPAFALGLLLVICFAVNLGIFPVTGVKDPLGYVLPIVTNGILSSAAILRMTRSSLLEVKRQDYIRTIRAKGASEWYVVVHHMLRNAMLPILTLVGVTFGISLGSIIVIESVFAIPGVSSMVLNGITSLDRPTVTAVATLLAFAVCLVNLIVDILYAVCDPRLRAQY